MNRYFLIFTVMLCYVCSIVDYIIYYCINYEYGLLSSYCISMTTMSYSIGLLFLIVRPCNERLIMDGPIVCQKRGEFKERVPH